MAPSSEITQALFQLYIKATADAVCKTQAVKRKFVIAEMGIWKEIVAGVLL